MPTKTEDFIQEIVSLLFSINDAVYILEYEVITLYIFKETPCSI